MTLELKGGGRRGPAHYHPVMELIH
jgi:hypothetical protein